MALVFTLLFIQLDPWFPQGFNLSQLIAGETLAFWVLREVMEKGFISIQARELIESSDSDPSCSGVKSRVSTFSEVASMTGATWRSMPL